MASLYHRGSASVMGWSPVGPGGAAVRGEPRSGATQASASKARTGGRAAWGGGRDGVTLRAGGRDGHEKNRGEDLSSPRLGLSSGGHDNHPGVGPAGFEPTTSCTPSKFTSQAEPG